MQSKRRLHYGLSTQRESGIWYMHRHAQSLAGSIEDVSPNILRLVVVVVGRPCGSEEHMKPVLVHGWQASTSFRFGSLALTKPHDSILRGM